MYTKENVPMIQFSTKVRTSRWISLNTSRILFHRTFWILGWGDNMEGD
jgi:hypothetical protein